MLTIISMYSIRLQKIFDYVTYLLCLHCKICSSIIKEKNILINFENNWINFGLG